MTLVKCSLGIMDRDPAVTTELTGELRTALRAAGVAEVDVSTRRRAEYSSDASLYRVLPAAVVFPRSSADVQATLAVCRELELLPVTARGAGTSIAGNAVGTGVILDLSRHLNRIEHIDPVARTASVQPGVVLDTLQRAVGRYGLRFGPDPSTHSRATIGGMIGNNACGSRALAYGRTADNVRELDLVTGTGELLAARPGMDPASSPTVTALAQVVGAHLGVIRTELGRFRRQVSGYSLEHLLPEHGFHVPAALVGTEGTCGVVLRATVDLVAPPQHTVLVVLGYPDMAAAADAAPALLPSHPITLEGLDARMVDVVRRRGAAVPELPAGSGWIFAELDTAGTSVADFVAAAGAPAARVVTDPAEAAALWRIREDGAGLAARSVGGYGAHAGWEDSAVPPAKLGAYLRDFEALLADRGLSGTPYGHFGDGCVHIRIDFPLHEPGGVNRYREFVTDAAKLVASYGGSLSGEHGDGRARSKLLPLMYSPAALGAFSAVKAVFDPDDLLNPGILVRPRPVIADLRIPAARPLRDGLAFGYGADDGDFTVAVHRCTGVAKCRADNTAAGGVMCPSFLATGDEKDSTRGRARVLQEMANGSWSPAGGRPRCARCSTCACPARVARATARPASTWPPTRPRCCTRPTGTGCARRRTTRWAGCRTGPGGRRGCRGWPTGCSACRASRGWASCWPASTAPAGAAHVRRSGRSGPGSPGVPAATGDPVLLWVDTFTDQFTPDVGRAAVRVLEAAGFAVRIPAEPLCCGLTWISTGQLDAMRNACSAAQWTRCAGPAATMPIVGLEPSCTAVFRGRRGRTARRAGGRCRGSRAHAGGTARRSSAMESAVPGRAARGRPAPLPPARGAGLVGRSRVAPASGSGCHARSAAVAAWQATSVPNAATTTCRSRSPKPRCCPPSRAAAPGTSVFADGFSCRTQLRRAGRRDGAAPGATARFCPRRGLASAEWMDTVV